MFPEVGEVTQQLRTLPTLPNDPGPIWWLATICDPDSGNPTLSSGICGQPDMHMVHRHTCGKTLVHIK